MRPSAGSPSSGGLSLRVGEAREVLRGVGHRLEGTWAARGGWLGQEVGDALGQGEGRGVLDLPQECG